MKVDPRHLAAVLAVVRHGTFSRAAEALGIGQPALSKSIALLERRLGTQLFDRTPRGSTLTAAGQIVALQAENLDFLLQRLPEQIAALREQLHGPLRIGATPSLMLGLVPQALVRMLHVYPGFTANIKEDLESVLEPALHRGEIDLLIAPLGVLAPPAADLVDLWIADEPIFVALPPGHRLARAAEVHLAELKDEAWVLPTEGGSFYDMVASLFVASGIPWPMNAIGTNRLHIHEELVAVNGRVAILSAAQLLGGVTTVRAVPLAGAPRRALGVRRRAGIGLHPAAAQFIEHLKEVAAGVETANAVQRPDG